MRLHQVVALYEDKSYSITMDDEIYDDLLALKRDNVRIVGKADQLTAAERELKRRLEYFDWDPQQPGYLIHTQSQRKVARRSQIPEILREIHIEAYDVYNL